MSKRNTIFGTGCYPAGLDGYVSSGENLLVLLCTQYIDFTSANNPRSTNVPRQLSTLILLLILRVIRSWNQTGQKHAGEPDIARNIFPSHTSLLWMPVFLTYLHIARRLLLCKVPLIPQKIYSTFSFVLCMVAFRFKVSFTSADAPELLKGLPRQFLTLTDESSLVVQAKAVFLGIGAVMLLAVTTRITQRLSLAKHDKGKIEVGTFDRWTTMTPQDVLPLLSNILTLFLTTQSRLTNIPLFLLFEVMLELFRHLDLSGDEITLASILLQFSSFFALGGSNSISSVDLSNAYNGIDGYRIAAVGVLTFAGNWAGPVWWMFAMTSLLLAHRQQHESVFNRHLWLLTAVSTGATLAVMLACTMLRAHLFIWTVFSPKYLYCIAWSAGQHFCVNFIIGSLIYWIGSS